MKQSISPLSGGARSACTLQGGFWFWGCCEKIPERECRAWGKRSLGRMEAIAIDKLSKSYGRIQALSGVSFKIEPGEVIGLLGPNGAGKTTLMKILTGYLEPDEGEVRVHGIDVVNQPIEAQRRIGYLPESAPLYSEMLVQEYLEMMAALRGVPYGDRRDRTVDAIRATGLADRAVQPIGTLSKG